LRRNSAFWPLWCGGVQEKVNKNGIWKEKGEALSDDESNLTIKW
jgi:hypothetical protein